MVGWFARLAPKLIQFKPDVLIATANQNYWFLLSYLRWLGIPIIPSFHCVLWPQFAPVRRSWRTLLTLNRIFILRHVKAALVASKDIARQLRSLVGETDIDIAEHLPTYSPSQFASIPSPGTVSRPPFRVFFAGRIEANKGIYDIVEIARRLNADRPGMFRFDICGDGGELDALRRARGAIRAFTTSSPATATWIRRDYPRCSHRHRMPSSSQRRPCSRKDSIWSAQKQFSQAVL